MAEERVQKILARAGYGSRRASEELITAGRVKINGEMAVLGSKADPQHDTITVDNQPIARAQAPIYIAVNKPTGILSEVSPEEPRQTVRDLVPLPGHLFIVGRLDLDSEGLILLTNDGELANRLTHPRYGHEKEHRVLVGARPDERQMDAWRHGVVLEDGYRTAPAMMRVDSVAGKGAWLRVILHEGRKRQIREMGKLTGLPVLRIQRIRIGTLLLGEMKPGEWRHLRPDEIRALKASKSNRAPERGPRRSSPRPGARNEYARSDRPRTERPRYDSDRSSDRDRTATSERSRPSGRPADRTRTSERSTTSDRARSPERGRSSTNERSYDRSRASDRSVSSDRGERSPDRDRPYSSDRSSDRPRRPSSRTEGGRAEHVHTDRAHDERPRSSYGRDEQHTRDDSARPAREQRPSRPGSGPRRPSGGPGSTPARPSRSSTQNPSGRPSTGSAVRPSREGREDTPRTSSRAPRTPSRGP